ncbi:MAG: hypothetical protein KDB23_04865, partial [Planctomycetales bacterium]|nr:hypothetical protein [Planctomycetales bacterium]
RNETRRLLWTLAHSHGTLLSLMNIALALTLPYFPSASRLTIISWTMVLAQWILPLGFFLGGAWPKGGDPSLWIVLVPLGGFFLLVSTLLIVYNLRARLARTHTGATPSQSPP